MKRLMIDFETSGLRHDRHAPVSIGVAIMEGEEVLQTYERIIAPPMYKDKISREYDVIALSISAITWSQIKSAPPIHQVMGDLEKFVADNDAKSMPAWAYNAPFDYAWYSECLFLSGSWNNDAKAFQRRRPILLGAWNCVMAQTQSIIELPDYRLDTVAAHFGLSRSGEKHGALEDAIIAGRILHRLSNLGERTNVD